MSVQEIFNAIQVNDHVMTAGQPTADQLRAAAEEGFTAVINLLPPGAMNAPPDEAGLVTGLGMAYVHIPVDWNAPTDADFDAFMAEMDRLDGEKLLIHCAANFRVTAFYSLYARQRLDWTETQAEAFRAQIWAGSDYPVWEDFIRRKQAEIRSD